MTPPLANTIERFCIAVAAAQGVRWADVSAETARNTRAGVSAGLMSMRGEAAPIGTALAMQTMDEASEILRTIAGDLADKAPESVVEALYALATRIDGLAASTPLVDNEAI